ncbi:DUF4097 domain-containing protein [Candidatus Poribacteria bacterium]|nr:DUF4097 domain-containing protein [Candidatus Poribacteria bacterium]
MHQSKRFMAVFLLCVLIVGCEVNSLNKDNAYGTSVSKKVSVEDIQKIIVNNVDGDINIRTQNSNEINITAEKLITADSMESARSFAQQVDIDVYRNGDILRIETVSPYSMSKEIGEVRVDYEIEIPLIMDVEVSNTTGDVTVEDTDGDIDIATTNGDIIVANVSGDVEATNINGEIALSDIEGEVDANSTNGDLTMSIRSATVNCQAKTTNGDIILYIKYDASTQGTLRTVNGKIESDFSIERPRREGRWELKLGSGDGKLDLWTTNGDIKLLKIDEGTYTTRKRVKK